MRAFIFILGALVTYEIVAQLAEYNRRNSSVNEDARMHRLRLINRNQEIAY